jgi:V8-like Glu-specific endopeptidase
MYTHLGQPPARAAAPAAAPVINLPLTRVRDATLPPWRAICRIVARSPGTSNFSVGTGFLVTPYHVLTCAHVIYPLEAPNTSEITVYPGQNGPDDSATHFKANGWAVSPRWQASNCMTAGEDYGIIRLAEKHGYLPLIPFDPADVLGRLVYLAGYPATMDPAARHLYWSRGRVLGGILINQCTLTTFRGTIVRNLATAGNLIAHDLDAARSVSGAPMWIRKDGTRRIIAIHSAFIASGAMRRAILLNRTVRQQIRAWFRSLPPIRR